MVIVPAGTPVQFGPAAEPLPQTLVDAIVELLRSIPVVIEAHLPMALIEGQMAQPEHLLIVVGRSAEDLHAAMPFVASELKSLLGPGTFLDVLPLRLGDPLLQLVRSAGCGIHGGAAVSTWR